MAIIAITEPDDPRLTDYRTVADPALARERGLFVVEGRLVVRRFLAQSRLPPRSVLVTAAALDNLSGQLGAAAGDLPVYVVAQQVMNTVAGFNIHRGCLALGERPPRLEVRALLDVVSPRRLVVLEAVSNADNVGGIFRSAAAFGADGMILGPGCCDPLYRKAIRTSIGTTLTMPHAATDEWPGALGSLRAAGFTVVALTPSPGAVLLAEVEDALRHRARVAVLVGAEGDGLTAAAMDAADLRVRIPIAGGVDSLNVTVAASIAMERLFGLRPQTL